MDKHLSGRLGRLGISLKALRELGFKQSGFYALYQLQLRSGMLRCRMQRSKSASMDGSSGMPARLFMPLDRDPIRQFLGSDGQERLLGEADEILHRRVRLFGGEPVLLHLQPPGQMLHWTEYERNMPRFFNGDIKMIWEPARFGWAFTLARAYQLTGDEGYPSAFWSCLEEFLSSNPPFMGLNWVSGQEVALRIIGWFFCWNAFASSIHSTADRGRRLAHAIVDHAARIPLSLAYARAQNNNHLLSEAAGLYTAGLALPNYPPAGRWRKLGWRIFHQALQDQIDEDGAYCQHSTNYHRLMLQLALWMRFLAGFDGQTFPASSMDKLSAATEWMRSLVDPISGGVPNLGPNDGAYIMPLSGLGQADYRSVLQAAGRLFLGKRFLLPGPWDEMGAWYGVDDGLLEQRDAHPLITTRTLHSPKDDSWVYLRAAHFRSRPGHADQLHVDLWWSGENLALDPGSYSYAAPDPWDNALVGADVHNTVTVNSLDQMKRVGRFLYLDWAQARSSYVDLDTGQEGLAAEHTGYANLGITHRRTVSLAGKKTWIIEDEITSTSMKVSTQKHQACLHWLMPDLPWEVQEAEGCFVIRLVSSQGPIEVEVRSKAAPSDLPGVQSIQMVREGKLVYGNGDVRPYWGWSSPTYTVKIPALSVRVSLEGELPFHFRSRWKLG